VHAYAKFYRKNRSGKDLRITRNMGQQSGVGFLLPALQGLGAEQVFRPWVVPMCCPWPVAIGKQ